MEEVETTAVVEFRGASPQMENITRQISASAGGSYLPCKVLYIFRSHEERWEQNLHMTFFTMVIGCSSTGKEME